MTGSEEYKRRWGLVDKTKKQAVTETKVRIRQAAKKKPYPRWQLVDFCGPKGGESRGIVDLIAIRKDHSESDSGHKRGDILQIILIQVKGGSAPMPTADDCDRLRRVSRQQRANNVLLAVWKKGKAPKFSSLRLEPKNDESDWEEIELPDLQAIFC